MLLAPARVCARARARLGPLGLVCPRGARVGLVGCGLFVGVWGRVGGAWGVWRAGDEGEGGGFDFFLPKKGPTGLVSAGPAGDRRDHAGAKARGAAPAPRRARKAEASCLYAASVPSVTNAIDGGDGRLADGRRRTQYQKKIITPRPARTRRPDPPGTSPSCARTSRPARPGRRRWR